jgi:hypothetical protein
MPKQTSEPRPAPSTFDELRREIARRNEVTHEKARKRRTEREREQVLALRRRELL